MNAGAIPNMPQGADAETECEARLASAVQDALTLPCPADLESRILGAVREQERGLHTWQAPWLLALPMVELALLVVLRSEVSAVLGPAARFAAVLRDATAPACEGCGEWLAARWQAAVDLLTVGTLLPSEGLPWIAGALVAAMSAAVVLAGLERRHA